VCVRLATDMRVLGTLEALGGTSAGAYHGSPGTVWLQHSIKGDQFLWVDHANKAWGCEKHSVYVDVTAINTIHPMRDACIHPTQVYSYERLISFNSYFSCFRGVF